jgi:hypothetical protein
MNEDEVMRLWRELSESERMRIMTLMLILAERKSNFRRRAAAALRSHDYGELDRILVEICR